MKLRYKLGGKGGNMEGRKWREKYQEERKRKKVKTKKRKN